MTTTEAQALKVAISGLSQFKTARRYPDRLREQVTDFTRRRVAAGESVASVSKVLDVGEPTLARFLAQPKRATFKQVTVTAPGVARTGPVVHAGGVVVEGLSVDEIAQLLRILTCSA